MAWKSNSRNEKKCEGKFGDDIKKMGEDILGELVCY